MSDRIEEVAIKIVKEFFTDRDCIGLSFRIQKNIRAERNRALEEVVTKINEIYTWNVWIGSRVKDEVLQAAIDTILALKEKSREIAATGLLIEYENLNDFENGRRLGKAEGFLECDEQVKPLVEALEKIRSKNGLNYSDFFEIADKTLYQWRKIQGEK